MDRRSEKTMNNIFMADSPMAEHIIASPNYNERRMQNKPDMVLLHYTGMDDAEEAVRRLCDPQAEVSAHYFIFEDGRIWQLVAEKYRAWHAGAGNWQGITDINSCSIGIELDNRGHNYPERDRVIPDFPDRQITSLIALIRDIVHRCQISPLRILAHSDIAPERKADPGEKFPWNKLAESGFGLTGETVLTQATEGDDRILKPGDSGITVGILQQRLQEIGYGINVTNCYDDRTYHVVQAFQRHFHQKRIDGFADAATLASLEKVYAGYVGGNDQNTD